MAWTEPSFPIAPVGAAEVVTLDGALLTGFRRGPLRTLQAPRWWTHGAVHDRDGRLVEASQRVGGLSGDMGVAADPEQVDVPRKAERLKGHWLYGGHWMGHFGHFLTESLTSLWPDPEPGLEGIVFHQFVFGGAVKPWQTELVGRTGHRLPVRVVGAEPLKVDRLTVPTRGLVPNGFAYAESAQVWRRIAGTVESPSPRRVFLSRSKFNLAQAASGAAVRTDPERDRVVDEIFAGLGFQVAFPEELPIVEQVALTAGAELVAGASGSGLHLSIFAPAGAGVIEVGDPRLRGGSLPAQRVLDTVCGHRSAVLPHTEDPHEVRGQLEALL